MTILIATIVLIALAMLGLAAGLLLRRRGLRGHCGGDKKHRYDANGKVLPCSSCTCPDPDQIECAPEPEESSR